MAILDEIGKKITVTGQETVQKAKDMADIAKLNSQIGELDKNIGTTCTEIGDLVLQLYGEIATEELIEQTEREENDKQKRVIEKIITIRKLQDEIAGCQEQIKVLKKVTRCPKCNGEISVDDLFCSKCGFKMETKSAEGLKQCNKCGAMIPEDAGFCTSCGAKVEDMTEVVHKVCSSCGMELEEEAVFCANCGTKVQ